MLRPVERLIYRAAGVRAEDVMGWKTYAVAMLLFNALDLLVVYALQRLQGVLPLNPQGFAAVAGLARPVSLYDDSVGKANPTKTL